MCTAIPTFADGPQPSPAGEQVARPTSDEAVVAVKEAAKELKNMLEGLQYKLDTVLQPGQ